MKLDEIKKSGVTPLTYMGMIKRTFDVKSENNHTSGWIGSTINGFEIEAAYDDAGMKSITILKDDKKIAELKPAGELANIKEFLKQHLS